MVRVYVGIHADMSMPLMLPIRLTTEAYCATPWVLGPSRPSTHAFAMWEHPDGTVYRLDGDLAGATLGIARAAVFDLPTALWEVSGVNEDAFFAAASKMAGVPYGWAEAVLQALPLPPLPAVLANSPLGQTLAGFKVVDVMKRAALCTRVAAVMLEAACPEGTALVASMKNLIPEHFGRLCQDAAVSAASAAAGAAAATGNAHAPGWIRRVL
jgi:hypothetical protein